MKINFRSYKLYDKMLFFLRFCCQLKTNPELNVEFVYGFYMNELQIVIG